MSSQSRRNTPDHLEALEPVDVLPARPPQSEYPFFSYQPSSLLHYWHILAKRKWVVLATFAIVFALSAIATLNEPRLYQAKSTVAIFPENQNALGFKDVENSYPDPDYESTLETQLAILRSDALAVKVIDALRLYQSPRFGGHVPLPESSIETSSMPPDPAQAARLLGAFKGGLSVQLVPNSRIVEVKYTDSDPRLAAEVANTLVKTYIEENFRTKYESANQTSDWLQKELADLQLRVQTSEEKLVRYQKDHSILGVDEKQNIVTSKLDELNKELTEAEMDRIEKEANYRLAMKGDPASFTKIGPERKSDLLDKLRAKQADLETQYAELTTQFGPAYPKVAELNNELKQVRDAIEMEKTRMRDVLRDEYSAAVQREDLLKSAFDGQKQEANQLNQSAIEYTVLKRDAETNRQLYQDLLQRLKEAGVSAGLRSSNIRVVDIARIPQYPIAPNVQRRLLLGILLGLGLGIGLALVLDSFDNTVRTMEELIAISGLPALGTIPLQPANGGGLRNRLTTISGDVGNPGQLELVVHEHPNSEAAEAYRALRTSILLSSSGAPPKVILVTSALPQEGKTTVSANSALVLAQSGSRVLLVDADLRRPSIKKSFGLSSQRGLSTLISGSDKTENAIHPFPEVPNLWILPAGPIPPQPAEILGSAVMKSHIARWRDEFDHIIIDTPPCLSVTDAVLLSPQADRVILVARSGQTTRPALRRACDLLQQVNARVMGTVLNALNLHSAEGYYYYGGRYLSYYQEEPTEDKSTAGANKVS